MLLFDGCGAHATVGELLPAYGPIFREVVDAALTLLPEGSHFVAGTKLNVAVLPAEGATQAHSFILDMNRDFLPDDLRYAQWVGELSLRLILCVLLRSSGSRRYKGLTGWLMLAG